MNRTLAGFGLILLLLCSVGPAQADVISQWNYSVNGIFTSWTDSTGNTYDYTNNPGRPQAGFFGSSASWGVDRKTLGYEYSAGQYAPGSSTGFGELRWGGRGPLWGGLTYSAVGLTGASGTMTTDGPTVDGMTLTHVNSELDTSYPTLSYGTVLATLALSPVGGPDLPVFSTSLEFYFFETPNDSAATERDIFLVRNPYVGHEYFEYDGVLYDFTFEASFEELTGYYADYVRRQLGWADDVPVYGWTTAEDGTTSFITELQVRHELMPVPTPEPGTLVLLGFGLAALGLAARRRRR